MHSPAAVRPEGPVDWALAPAPRSIEQGSPKAPAVARDQIHREEVKIQKTIEIQNPQFKKNTRECSLLEKCPAARFGSAWQCYLMWLRIGDCGSIMTSSSSTSTRFSRQSHLMEKTVHSVEHKPHNSLTISSFMAFPICSYHSEHQIPWIPMDPHGSCLEIFMSSFMSW